MFSGDVTLQPPGKAPIESHKMLQTLKTAEAETSKNQGKPPRTTAQRRVYVKETDSEDEQPKERPPTPGKDIQWDKIKPNSN